MDMMKQLEEKGLGEIMDGTWYGGLMYVDDIVLLAKTGAELQKMLDVVGHYMHRSGGFVSMHGRAKRR